VEGRDVVHEGSGARQAATVAASRRESAQEAPRTGAGTRIGHSVCALGVVARLAYSSSGFGGGARACDII
jgi:hypothetical protein